MYTIFNSSSRNPSFWLFLSASGHNFERETIASGGRGFIIVVKKMRGWKFLLNFEIIAIVCLSREEFKPSEIGIAIPTVSFVLFSKEEKKEIFSFFLCPLHRFVERSETHWYFIGILQRRTRKTRHYSKRFESRGLFSALLIILHSKFLFSPPDAIEFITRRIYRGLNRRNGMLEGCKDEIEHVDKNGRAGERE